MNVPLVLLSGHSDRRLWEMVKEVRPDAVVPKPITDDGLRRAMSRCMDRILAEGFRESRYVDIPMIAGDTDSTESAAPKYPHRLPGYVTAGGGMPEAGVPEMLVACPKDRLGLTHQRA